MDVSHDGRKDEIGDMLIALEVFRQNGIANEKLEASRREDAERKLARAREIETSINAFKSTSSEMLEAMSGASERMATASDQLHNVSSQSATFTENVTRAAGIDRRKRAERGVCGGGDVRLDQRDHAAGPESVDAVARDCSFVR